MIMVLEIALPRLITIVMIIIKIMIIMPIILPIMFIIKYYFLSDHIAEIRKCATHEKRKLEGFRKY